MKLFFLLLVCIGTLEAQPALQYGWEGDELDARRLRIQFSEYDFEPDFHIEFTQTRDGIVSDTVFTYLAEKDGIKIYIVHTQFPKYNGVRIAITGDLTEEKESLYAHRIHYVKQLRNK